MKFLWQPISGLVSIASDTLIGGSTEYVRELRVVSVMSRLVESKHTCSPVADKTSEAVLFRRSCRDLLRETRRVKVFLGNGSADLLVFTFCGVPRPPIAFSKKFLDFENFRCGTLEALALR